VDVSGRIGGKTTDSQEGTVRWFNDTKGYDLIWREAEDVTFGHHSDIINRRGFACLRENQKIEFSVQNGPRALRATGVKSLQSDTQSGGYPRETHVRRDDTRRD